MISIGDKVIIKNNLRPKIRRLFNEEHNKIVTCGVLPYHIDKPFIVMRTYGDNLIVRVFSGKQTYSLNRNIFRKVK